MGQLAFPLEEGSDKGVVLLSPHWGVRKEIQVVFDGKVVGTLDRLTVRGNAFSLSGGGTISVFRRYWGVDVRHDDKLLPNSSTHPTRMIKAAGIALGVLGVWYFMLSVLSFLLNSSSGPLLTEAFRPFAFGGALVCLGLGHVVYWHQNRLALVLGALFYTCEPSIFFFDGESHFVIAKIFVVILLWRPLLFGGKANQST